MPQITTLTDSTTRLIALSEAIHRLDFTEIPLLKHFGYGEGNLKKLGPVRDWPSTTLKWMEDTMSPVTSTLDGAHNNSVTTINVAAGTGVYFRKGDIILVNGAEKMTVNSVSTDALTVNERGLVSTSAGTYVGGETVKAIGRAMPEGSDYTLGHVTARTTKEAYAQIISQAVEVTKSELRQARLGIDNLFDYEVAKLFDNGGSAGELVRRLAYIFYYGEAQARTASLSGMAGGFRTFVTTNVTDLGGVSLQKSDIHTKLRQVRDAAGKVDTLIGNSAMIEVLNGIYPADPREQNGTTGGDAALRTVKTPHGEVKILYDWMCPDGQLYFVNSSKVGWVPFREFAMTEYKEIGDKYAKDIVGEYTFFVRDEKSHGLIHNIATGL